MMTDFGLKPDTIAKIQAIFAQNPAIEQVLIYGSRARGDYRNGSDIDLTIIGQLDEPARSKIYWQIDALNLPYLIDLSLFNHLSNPLLIQNIQTQGKVFYQKS
ncbi:MAG: nucleotidyltransferase domain-containing protein [Acinetobacter sp.]|nr:nucleotidyltransferase domain-containing protein [Acinetobacter sp.]